MKAFDSSPARIEALESVRGVAALLIVFFHIPGWNSTFFNIQLIQHGYLMVNLFFVLSGFVIFHAYGERLHNWRDICRFQFLRFGRLYPVHILFLLFFLAIEIAKYLAATRFNVHIPNSAPFRENNWIAFFQQLALIQDIGPTGNALTFNIPAWSISVEFYTYLMFAFITKWSGSKRVWAFCAMAFVSLVLLIANLTFGFRDLLLCTSGFFLGCLTAALSSRYRPVAAPFASAFFVVGIAALLASRSSPLFDLLIYPLTVGLILTLAGTTSGAMHRFLTLRSLVWLGGISYSLYMSHETVLWFVNQILRVVLRRPEAIAGGRSVPQLSFSETAIAYPLALVAILAVAYMTFHFVEVPFRQRSRVVASKL